MFNKRNFQVFRFSQTESDLETLLKKCRAGDTRAFEMIVERYRDHIFWTAYHLVPDYEEARDITQQSLIKIWKSIAQYDSGRSFQAWTAKITANCAIDFLRTQKKNDPLPEEMPEFRSLDKDLDIRKIFETVAPLLAERQRLVLVLREMQGLEFSEIAELLDCTESTARNLLSQAKESFRQKTRRLFPHFTIQH